MSSGPGRFLLHASITLGMLAVALLVYAHFGNGDIAFGNLVLRTQKGTSYPLQAPSSSSLRPRPPSVAEEYSDAPGVGNVVIFIGDGMGVGTVSAASALLERPGSTLNMMETSFIGLVRTWAANTLATDSAASGTALATGFKTNKKIVSMLPDGSVPRSLFEAAQNQGVTTGVITTSGLVDATPACFSTHVTNRDHHDQILEQMLDSGTSALIGGDWSNNDKAKRNRRFREMESRAEELGAARGYHVIRNPDALNSASLPILALFPPRNGFAEQHGPPLAVSAHRVVELLLQEKNRFLLLIECEVIDGTAHENDIEKTMAGMRELDEAVGEVLALVSARGDTLVLVTADHDAGGLSLIDGYYEDGATTVRWSTKEHTSEWVPLFAFGPGAERFAGMVDNTELPVRIAQVLDLHPFPYLTESATN
ncbi:MAG: alkaline phosphatase [Acidobacteriota bacterium]